MMKKVKIILLSFISEKAALVYIFLFGLSIGVATFIENDFGTDGVIKHLGLICYYSYLG
jgi:hypothetical protein